MDNQKQIESFFTGSHACVTITTYEEGYVLRLIREAAVNIRRDLWVWSINGGLRDSRAEHQADTKTEHPAAALYELLNNKKHKLAVVMLDLVPHLEDAKTMRLLRDLLGRYWESGDTLFMIDHSDDLPKSVSAYATRFEPALPDEKAIERLVKDTLRGIHRETPLKVEIKEHDMVAMLKNLRGLNHRQVERVITECVREDWTLKPEDINHILAAKRRSLGSDGLLEYIETPADLSQIGGLNRLKRWLTQRSLGDTSKAAGFGLEPPRGVLLLGVQGAGKSLCAKATATAWQRPLLRMDPGVLYNRFIGESERRLRDALHQAEAMAPVVLWVDEIEKGFASAAGQSTDGGLSRRMFGSLLTWMQDHQAPVFMVATANDIESLPPELLRKGRFDEIFFVDLPGPEARRAIFKVHLTKRDRDAERFDLNALADATDGYSGAEIEQGIVSALHEAYGAGEKLDTARLIDTLGQSPPLSVTMAEKVRALRAWAKGRCVPADDETAG